MFMPKRKPSLVSSVLPAHFGTRDVKRSHEITKKVQIGNNSHFTGAGFLDFYLCVFEELAFIAVLSVHVEY